MTREEKDIRFYNSILMIRTANLVRLKLLLKQKEISEEFYENKRKEILKSL